METFADGRGGRHEMLLVGENLGHLELMRHGVKPYLRRRVESAGRLGGIPAQSRGSPSPAWQPARRLRNSH